MGNPAPVLRLVIGVYPLIVCLKACHPEFLPIVRGNDGWVGQHSSCSSSFVGVSAGISRKVGANFASLNANITLGSPPYSIALPGERVTQKTESGGSTSHPKWT